MRVRIEHVTRYGYDEPVQLGPHVVRLTPAPHVASRVLTYNLQITPEPKLHWQLDAWANRIARATFDDHPAVTELEIRVDATFDLQPVNPFDFFVEEACEHVPFTYPDAVARELRPFMDPESVPPQVHAWIADLPHEGFTTDYLVALNQKVSADVGYVIRNEPGIQTPAETLQIGSGSCRDSAWLLVAAARARGYAARFVSGYLIQLEDEGNIPGVARGLDRDVVDLHAWAEIYVPGAGWIGLDGTSGLFCTEGHIPLAASTEPDLAAPLSGWATGPATRFGFEQRVARIGHEPRPRKPYTDEQYAALLETADTVDDRIAAKGISLTCGGEPTWTSREHPTEPCWSTEAMGTTKWTQGLRMAAEVHRRMAPGGVVLHQFGKHYPGESLPRWALHVIWRRDGTPVWRDPDLLDLPSSPHPSGVDLDGAERFAKALLGQLGLDAEPMPAFEDPWYAVATEADLPEDVDPYEADLDDPESRQRLARMLSRGLEAPVGFVTPLQLQQTEWLTQPWQFRRGRLTLLPGDSPIGLRLPLERLPGSPAPVWPVDPQAQTGELPVTVRSQSPAPGQVMEPAGGDVDHVRTALCIEPRDGILHVFIPPLASTEAWLELVGQVEATAREVGLPVRLEGYAPPHDARLVDCAVTPDPGVLEINVPPVHSTRAYAEQLELLADAATHAGLCTERFLLDGSSVGSGGGNHQTLGGPTTTESVFLTHPHVLASLVRYVQHHPSLSYFFSGLFVGPTSQAPRIDEARDEILDEVELALDQLDRAGDPPAPWFIDRLLRNLLVDLTGNTHRAELSIDKLHNPGSPTGRLGVVEFRAFEMPPNERMCAAQTFLLRALILRFLERPFTAPLIRWGARLHDRYMLPHFLWEDLLDVLDDLRREGICEADPAWFEPFRAYRFPLMGRLDAEGVVVTLRPALEPWPVLGEEPSGATVSRYVDSSLERIEITVRGLDETRHVIAANGVEVPLTRARDGEHMVAGVRFRAWQPPHCLHPHIGVHHPLRIDVLDTWADRSMGALTYHVWHPEGRSFDEPPLTAFEASARRASRVTYDRHQPHPATAAAPPRPTAGRVTLDMRWTGTDKPLPFVDTDA